MRHGFSLVLTLTCLGALFLVCYAPAFFRDRQFGYRDSGHYYYPLNKRVQTEWNEGRWPLWEPEENAGMPLLGNPTAAVLYPGKLIFAILPYAWGARVYVVAHSALAFLNMLVLMRSWGTSWHGSALSALAYAFGAPVLFQYCNIIYLVGAAWLPLGLRAIDRWVRLGRRSGILELAVVLSMQTLGGDPQAAYLLGPAGIGYAFGLACARARANESEPSGAKPGPFRRRLSLLWVLIGLVVWFVTTVALAHWLPGWRGPGNPRPPLRWTPWLPLGATVVWCSIAVGLLCHWRGRFWRYRLGAMLTGLASSAALAVALTAAQVLPVVEFTQQTDRDAGEGQYDIYQFSLEPFRLIEAAWPNILGIPFEGKNYWSVVIKTPGGRPAGWVPSLYMGGLTCAMALSALATRRGPPWRVWLTVMASVCLLGSLGQYASPIWMARALAATSSAATLRSWLPELGPFDPLASTPIRLDGYLRDGDGGVYWWLTAVLPAFRQFRFPAKLFTFTALGMAALAGLGWDGLVAGRTRGIATIFLVLLGMTLATSAGVVSQKQPILASFQAADSHSVYGQLDAAAGYQAILRSLGQATIVFGVGLGLTILARKRPQLAGSAALIVMTADLAAANARHILTVPQSLFENKPEVLKIIEEAERTQPSPGPFRIHRMPLWYPLSWETIPSNDRTAELARWERDTLQPKYGINLGVEYTQTIGVAQLDDYDRYFIHFPANVHDGQLAQALGIDVGNEVEYYLRRSYDLWNTRYFIVPFFANGWRDATRGSASFVFRSALVYPPSNRFIGPKGSEEADKWIDTRDFRILRNLQEFPRAWVVHRARTTVTGTGQSRWALSETMQEILYANDGIWNDAPRPVYDPYSVAWVSKHDFPAIHPLLSGRTFKPSERVRVTYPNPQQAVLEVSLDSPGLVILADVYYPGWELTIDGESAPIYKVNGLMRGAAVPSGPHRLVYTYSPLSWRVGRLVSIAGLAVLLILGLSCARWPYSPILT